MIFNFPENRVKSVFEVNENGNLLLLHLGADEMKYEINEKSKKYFSAFELQLTGENQNDHHGFKQTVTSASVSLKYKNHKYYKNEYGNKLEFYLEDSKISAALHYQFYDDADAVRSWSTVSNISSDDVGIEYISSLSLVGIDIGGTKRADEKLNILIPHNSWCREYNWKRYSLSELGFDMITPFSTKRLVYSNSGTWSSKEYLPMGCVENTQTQDALMWQIENNGSWSWEISDISGYIYLKLSGPSERENSWYKNLKQGESFESVKAALAFGKGFDGALSSLTKYRRKIVRKNKADSYLPVIFNDYMNCLWAEPTEEKMIPVIDKAAEAGAEYYVMDAGWYADGTWWETVGEWQPCAWRFKNGIKKVFDYIRSKGMIPGIWLEIEVMGINCPILDKFSDDCFFTRHGKKVIDHGRYQLDFRNEKVRTFADSVIDRVVTEYGAGYIKMDYNIDGGLGTETDSDSFGDGLLSHNRAYLKWIESVMDRYPDLIIENCSSGAMRADYAMMSVHTIASVTDQEDCKNTAAIAASAATAFLPEQASVWSYPKMSDSPELVSLNMVSSLLLRMNLSGEIMKLNDSQLNSVKEGVKCYKEIRKNIPEFIPFYPLGINDLSSEWLVSGYKYRDGAYLSVCRRNAKEETVSIPLKCSSAEIVYPKNENCSLELEDKKMKVSLKSENCAVVIKIK